MSRENEKFYLGLDIGTESVGAAATDEEYRPLKIAGGPALSVRLFDKCNTAEERRGFRTAHRRLMRRRARVLWLKELFGKELAKKDPSFLYRLANSDLWVEDKESEQNPHPTAGKYSLFYDPDYNDGDFMAEYPTVYHLRKAWREGSAGKDLRTFYLALQHIVKYRGNFLREGETFGGALPAFASLIETWRDALEVYREEEDALSFSELTPGPDEEGVEILRYRGDAIEELFKTEKFRSGARRKAFAAWLGWSEKSMEGWVRLVLGEKVNPDKLFGKGRHEKEAFQKFDVEAGNYDEWQGDWRSVLTEGEMGLVDGATEIYRWQTMAGILDGYSYLSDAMIAKYEKHKADLALLKSYLKEVGARESYRRIFSVKAESDVNYAAYVGNRKGKPGKAKREDFCKFLKKELEGLPFDARKEKILNEIEAGTFLPKINTTENGVIPYQLHLAELEKILKVGEEVFPFLKERDEYGSVSEKVISLVKFRIPYFVGPLQHASKSGKGFGWLKRKEGVIRPWTYKEIVDEGASGQEFIRRMTLKCTYLPKFDVLPKHALLYEEYLTFNELNKLKVNDALLSLETKERLIEELYRNPETKGRVTIKKLRDFLKGGDANAKVRIKDYGNDLQGDMKTWRDFYRILGEKLRSPDVERGVECYIEYATVFEKGEDAMRYFRETEYAALFDEEELRKMKALTFAGWGRLSRELLELELQDPMGELRSVMEILRTTSYNLMQILESKEAGFDFPRAARRVLGTEEDQTPAYEMLKEEYCSPSVRRSVWQTLRVAREYIKELGTLPCKVFIEVTREEDPKKKKKLVPKRKEELNKKYQAWLNAERARRYGIPDGITHSLGEKEDQQLKEDKLYLYYQQLGKCAYTGEPIDLDRPGDYDIDHIIPQAVLKDDSLDNRVLVKKTENARKSAQYPLQEEIIRKNAGFWRALREAELISKEKYERLIRRTSLTSEELNGFIHRQLVETAQAAKLAAKYLEMEFDAWRDGEGNPIPQEQRPEIVLVKAGNVSEFRKQFGLFKVRDINDLHHAHDAYLNIVVGNVMNELYSHNRNWEYLRELSESEEEGEERKSKSEMRTLNFKKTFYVSRRSDRGERLYTWRALYASKADACEKRESPYATVHTVRKVLSIGYFPVTKMEKTETGSFYGLQRTGKEALKSEGIPVKEGLRSDTKKYGGYKGTSTAYFSVVKVRKGSVKKPKFETHIRPVSIYHDTLIRRGKLSLKAYLADSLKVKEEEITIEFRKLNKFALLEMVAKNTEGKTERTRMRLNGCSNTLLVHNANEAWFDIETSRYLKEVLLVRGKIAKILNGDKDPEKREKTLNGLEEDKARRKQLPQNRDADIVFLTQEGNRAVYLSMAEKLSKPPYRNLQAFEGYARSLREGVDRFAALGMANQLDVLANIVQFFRCGAINLSLAAIGGASIINAIQPAMNITGKTVYYIAQSPAGFRERRILLNQAKTEK